MINELTRINAPEIESLKFEADGIVDLNVRFTSEQDSEIEPVEIPLSEYQVILSNCPEGARRTLGGIGFGITPTTLRNILHEIAETGDSPSDTIAGPERTVTGPPLYALRHAISTEHSEELRQLDEWLDNQCFASEVSYYWARIKAQAVVKFAPQYDVIQDDWIA